MGDAENDRINLDHIDAFSTDLAIEWQQQTREIFGTIR